MTVIVVLRPWSTLLPGLGTRKTPTSPTRTARLRILLWLVIASLGLSATVASLAVTRHSPTNHVELSGDSLLITSRDRLAICIKPISGASVDTARARSVLEHALQELERDPLWLRSAYAKSPPVVDVNCSEQPSILDPTVTVTTGSAQASRIHADPRTPAAPSKYHTIIFILPNDLMERYFFGITTSDNAKYRKEPEEYLCPDHACIEVTRGLYLLSEEITDPLLVLSVLRQVLGFERT